MRYAALLSPQAVARVHTVLAGHGTVDVLLGVRELLAELALPRDECIVLDPALVSVADAESIAAGLTHFPRSVVAFASVSVTALQSSVVLAQQTSARFVFRGTPNERSALERALLLTPDVSLGLALLSIIEHRLNSLPAGLRERVRSMFRNGDGPCTPDALAAASALGRRSLDRYLVDAGFVPARRIVDAARVSAAYRVITTSRTPLTHVSAMLGYTSLRTMGAQVELLLDTTCARLRADPISCTEAAERLANKLTTRERRNAPAPRHIPPDGGAPSLKLVDGHRGNRRPRRTASGER